MPAKAKSIKVIVVIFLAILCCFGLWFFVFNRLNTGSDKNSESNKAFNKQQYSLVEPASLWMIVNKQRPLPGSYQPAPISAPDVSLRTKATDPEMKLRADILKAVEKLVSEGTKQGHDLMLVSGYRSFASQGSIYNSFVSRDGQSEADRTSARAGHSEHQTGLAVDFGTVDRKCELEECFGATKAGQWLAAHASDYGFVLRYPKDKESIVGYAYEPWHFRYVGEDLARELQKSGQTLEEFFGLPAAPGYL